MFDKLRSYPKYLIFLTAISLLLALPAFAKPTETKRQTKQTAQTQNQNSEVKLAKFDATVAYNIWNEYYLAQEKGINLPLPVFKPNADPEAVKQLTAMWNEGQQKAYRNFVRRMEQKAKVAQQTQQQSNPGQNTVKLEKFDTNVAYKIWKQYYQAQEKGLEPSLPAFDVTNNTRQEAKRLMAIWNKGAEKAKQEAEQRREDARTGKTSFQAKPITPLVSDPLLATQPTPITNNVMHLNQRPKGIAGISAFTMNPTSQPNQTQVIQNAQNNVILNANNSVNRSIAEQNKENIAYNVAKAQELANIAYPLTQTSGVTTHYLIDDNNITGLPQVVEEIQNGQVVRQYSYGADGLISMRQLINGQWVVSFFVKDGYGSVRMLTDVNGNVTDTYDYDAFGNLIAKTGNTPNTRLYAGEEFDEDLGFYYLRARFLDTIKGRFLSQDKSEGTRTRPLSLHKYLYAAPNPVNNIDPTGFDSITTISNSFNVSLVLAALPTMGLSNARNPVSENVKLDKLVYETFELTGISGVDFALGAFVTNKQTTGHYRWIQTVTSNDATGAIRDAELGKVYTYPDNRDRPELPFFYTSKEELYYSVLGAQRDYTTIFKDSSTRATRNKFDSFFKADLELVWTPSLDSKNYKRLGTKVTWGFKTNGIDFPTADPLVIKDSYGTKSIPAEKTTRSRPAIQPYEYPEYLEKYANDKP